MTIDWLWFLTSVASIGGIGGALLNATGRLKLSFCIWGFTNSIFLVTSLYIEANMFVILMWATYLVTTFIGLKNFWGDKLWKTGSGT